MYIYILDYPRCEPTCKNIIDSLLLLGESISETRFSEGRKNSSPNSEKMRRTRRRNLPLNGCIG